MLESLEGLLVPWTRQNEGSFVSVTVGDTTSVPDVTGTADVMVVLPSNERPSRVPQATAARRGSPECCD
jgi:hypothetical protein